MSTNRWLVSVFVVIVVIQTLEGLECYTGYSVVRGQTVGTTTEVCKGKSDQCYKAKADINLLNKLKLAGCSTFRCMLARNTCINQTIAGQNLQLCCCNDKDFCNGAQPNSIKSMVDKVKNAVTGGGLSSLSKILG